LSSSRHRAYYAGGLTHWALVVFKSSDDDAVYPVCRDGQGVYVYDATIHERDTGDVNCIQCMARPQFAEADYSSRRR
jgi:hypothetical protein